MTRVEIRACMVSEDYLTSVEVDAKERARAILSEVKGRRGGKFKLSEAQFVEEMERMWVGGEFSSAERILRAIEMKKEVDSVDMVRGEIHLFLLFLFEIVKRRFKTREDLKLEDMIYGKYSTEHLRNINPEMFERYNIT